MAEKQVEWTDYLRYRAALRSFDLARIEHIVRYSIERYVDNVTGREIAVGRHERQLVAVPCEVDGEIVRPVTVHTTTRRQIEARLRSGRLTHE